MTVKRFISVQTDVTNIGILPIPKRADNGVSLDTLAQLRTKADQDDIGPLRKCTKTTDKKTLKKRARRKYLGSHLALKLVDAAKGNEEGDRAKSYWGTFHCASVLHVSESGKVSGKYCKQRWCPVCNAIRTAKLINQYKPHFQDWEDPQFVTLTIPNVCQGDLRDSIEAMQTNFRKVKDSLNRTAKRNGRTKLKGVRKLECTFNLVRNDYHPHYHFLIEGKVNSNQLVNRWLKAYPTANRKAQDVRPADDRSLIELFKYFTKLVTTGPNGKRVIYADALDVVFNAVTGIRTFQPFGFKLSALGGPISDVDPECDRVIEIMTWDKTFADWVNPETGEMLSGYVPGEGMRDLIENQIRMRPRGKGKGLIQAG
jgi:hypothetical protein